MVVLVVLSPLVGAGCGSDDDGALDSAGTASSAPAGGDPSTPTTSPTTTSTTTSTSTPETATSTTTPDTTAPPESTTSTPVDSPVPVAGTYRLPLDQPVAVGGGWMLVARAVDDSRCPDDVVCVWEGELEADVELDDGSSVTPLSLTWSYHAEPTAVPTSVRSAGGGQGWWLALEDGDAGGAVVRLADRP